MWWYMTSSTNHALRTDDTGHKVTDSGSIATSVHHKTSWTSKKIDKNTLKFQRSRLLSQYNKVALRKRRIRWWTATSSARHNNSRPAPNCMALPPEDWTAWSQSQCTSILKVSWDSCNRFAVTLLANKHEHKHRNTDDQQQYPAHCRLGNVRITTRTSMVAGDVVLEARPWPRGQIVWPWPWKVHWHFCHHRQTQGQTTIINKLIIVIIIN